MSVLKRPSIAAGVVQKVRRVTDSRVLRVASDCSGWCSELFALRGLKVDFEHVFSSEKDLATSRVMQLLWGHLLGVHCKDMTKRNHNHIPDNIDLYVAGIPCQPFSVAGKGFGLADGRSEPFIHALAVLDLKKPKRIRLRERSRTLHRTPEHIPGHDGDD